MTNNQRTRSTTRRAVLTGGLSTLAAAGLATLTNTPLSVHAATPNTVKSFTDISVTSAQVRNPTVNKNNWPLLTCPLDNTLAVTNANLALDKSRKLFFQGDGKVSAFDDTHAIVLGSTTQLLDLYE